MIGYRDVPIAVMNPDKTIEGRIINSMNIAITEAEDAKYTKHLLEEFEKNLILTAANQMKRYKEKSDAVIRFSIKNNYYVIDVPIWPYPFEYNGVIRRALRGFTLHARWLINKNDKEPNEEPLIVIKDSESSEECFLSIDQMIRTLAHAPSWTQKEMSELLYTDIAYKKHMAASSLDYYKQVIIKMGDD